MKWEFRMRIGAMAMAASMMWAPARGATSSSAVQVLQNTNLASGAVIASNLTVNAIPYAGTGKKLVDSPIGVSGPTNVTIKGALFVDSIVATNGVQVGSGGTNFGVGGNFTAYSGNFTNSLKVNSVDVLTTAAVSDTAYASSWNGVGAIAPSKNAVYDWGHLFDTDDDGKVNVLDMGAGMVKTDASGVVSAASEGTDYLGATRIDDTAYNATSWNGDTTHAASKNAVRDEIESLIAGTASLNVQEADGSPNVSGVTTIKVSNGTLTDNTGGVVTITTGGGSSSNALLDGSAHTDTVAASVVSGDLVYGNSTPKWDRIALGSFGQSLTPWLLTNNTLSLQWKNRPVVDDFLTTTLASSFNWSSSTANGGSNGSLTGEAGHLGEVSILSGASTNGISVLRTATTTGPLGAAKIAVQFRFKTPAALSDGTDGYELAIGFNHATSAQDGSGNLAPADAAFVYYYHASSVNWQAKTYSGNIATTATTTGTSVYTAAAWWDVFIEADSSVVNFWVSSDGGATWTHIGYSTTNLPSGAGHETGLSATINKKGGTTSRTLAMDKVWFWQ